MIVLLMGVAGCGKSTIGRALAAALEARFEEGDAFHPASNVEKMSRGEPLTDADRLPWLNAIAAAIGRADQAGERAVFACSALKRSYRDILRGASARLRVVHLAGGEALIRSRLEARKGHFMPPTLLPSQLRILEAPGGDETAVVIDIADAPETIVARIRAALEAPPPTAANPPP